MTGTTVINGGFLVLVGCIMIGMGVRQKVGLAIVIGLAFIAVGIGIAIGAFEVPA